MVLVNEILELLMFMLFMHVIGDWLLQNKALADMKQKLFWKKAIDDMQLDYEDYKYDYIAALLNHSVCWSVCILIPAVVLKGFTWGLFIIFIVNTIVHAYIDNQKANEFSINLVKDQIYHLVFQILPTLLVLVLIYNWR